MDTKKRLFQYLKPLRSALIIATIFSLLFVASQIAQPFLLGKALDASSVNNRVDFIRYVFIALILAIIGTVSAYIFEVMVMNASQKIIKQARDDVYQKINSISLKDFDNKYRGDLLLLEIRDMENYAAGLFAVFKTLIQGIFTVVITIIMMFLVNWILAVGVIILSPLSMLMARFVSKFSGKYFKKQNELQAHISSISLETLNNIDVVQSLNYEEASLENFNKENNTLKEKGTVASFSASWVNPSTRLVNNIIYVMIGIVGIIMLAYDSDLAAIFAVMSIGRLSSFLSYTNQYTKPFNEISGVANEYEAAKASFRRINSFLNLNDDLDTGVDKINNIESISFKDMSFSYDPNRKLIENFSLNIKKGQKVAIVGPTGAGKTTLINLLMRFYDPISGDIYINDKSYLELSKASLRSNIGMVLQDTWIYSGTIMDNIRYGRLDATDEECIEAAKVANAHDFITRLPEGYQTMLSGDGANLSQGQRQLLSIARAAVADTPVMILDEATSSIDTRTEKLVQQGMDQLMEGRTVFVIAHRLSTIQNAEAIMVLDHGEIIERGNHKDLIAKKGYYYQLYTGAFELE